MNSTSHSVHRGERAHRLGVGVNFLLAVVKTLGGILSGSTALLADGYHSFSDLATNGIAWFSFRVAARPADDDHHYGHGKAEAAAGVFVGTVLFVVGITVLWQAFMGTGPVYVGYEAPLALAIAVFSVAANEWLVKVTRRSAEELSSHALRALARDNRSDSLSSVLVIVGVLGSLLGWAWAEPVATGVIGVFIMVMALRSFLEGFDVLMDRVSPDMRPRIEAQAQEVSGVVGVQTVFIHPLGAEFRVDMEISVDGDLSVRKGHAIAHEVEEAVTRAEPQVVQVAVHVNPAQLSGAESP